MVRTTILATMRPHGFHKYYRGHFGHSMGPPLACNATVIELNAMLALEAPCCANGIGVLVIEEQSSS